MKSSVIEAEEQLICAMKSSNVQGLERMLYNHMIFTDHNGQVLTKASDLELHRSGRLAISRIDVSGQLILQVEDVCLVSVKQYIEGNYDGTSFSGNFQYTRVWKKMDGRLQVIAASCVAVA